MTIGGVSGAALSGISAAIVSDLSTAMASVGEDGIKVTLSKNATDAANLQQDMTGLDIGIAALKSEMRSEQVVVNMVQDSVDMRV
jgi:hypothetical protein